MVVTVAVSMATRPKPRPELKGLVYGCTVLPSEGDLALYQKPLFWACIVGAKEYYLKRHFRNQQE